tara:strand:- start:27 stop:1715 length:1689 start_codon:yes stop_codon:yes gene_type:complete
MELLKLNEYQERSYAERPSARGWVNYGDDNLFPQYLIDLYKSSATHNALCTSIAYMIYGDGVQADTLEARLKIEEWGLQDEVRKACLDLKIQGGFALELVYSIDRTTVSKVRHCPFENIRTAEVDEDENLEFVYYSKDWSDQREEPQEVKTFDPEQKNEFPVQILYVKPFSPGSYYYPKPDYIGSIDYIELDKEIGKYHINNIKNGLAPSFTIHFKNGVPAQEERRRIRNDIERQLAGATNAGKFIVTYSDSPDRKPDFEPFPLSDADKQYQFLSTEVSDKIMVGHRVVSSAMFGVKTAGQLGNTQELEIASELFDKQVIKPYQRIVKDALSSIFTAADTPTTVTVEEVPPMDPETPTELSHEGTDLTHACDYLIEMGEEMGDEWELIDARRVDYEEEDKMDALWSFARVPSGKPQAKSEQDDELIKVRYAYMPKVTGKNGNESRDFCKRMVNAGERVWRKEDIDAASTRAVNPGWGPEGANTYDLWLYKGGGSCQHFWERRTYLRKNNKKVSVNRARNILREAGLDPLPVNDPRVAKRPRDMRNRGFLPSNKAARNISTPK